MRDCPCRDCPNRTITCHGKCEDYQTWKKEWEDYKIGKPDTDLMTNPSALRKYWRNLRFRNRRYRP